MSTWIADIPPAARETDHERTLVISPSPKTGGWFLFVCESDPSKILFDYWFETFELALRQGAYAWGIRREDWREFSAPGAPSSEMGGDSERGSRDAQ